MKQAINKIFKGQNNLAEEFEPDVDKEQETKLIFNNHF